MAQLCANLERSLGKVVWDETGLKGNYYVSFRYALDDVPADVSVDAPPLNAALLENLGLQITKRKGQARYRGGRSHRKDAYGELMFAQAAGNHLWQSTLCVAVAWLLTLALRKNRASVRYGLWLAASVKFLVPFSWLAALGASLHWQGAPVAEASRLPVFAAQIEQPFAMTAPVAFPAAVAQLRTCGMGCCWSSGFAESPWAWSSGSGRRGG